MDHGHSDAVVMVPFQAPRWCHALAFVTLPSEEEAQRVAAWDFPNTRVTRFPLSRGMGVCHESGWPEGRLDRQLFPGFLISSGLLLGGVEGGRAQLR